MILKWEQIFTLVLNCVYILLAILFIFTLKSDSMLNCDSLLNCDSMCSWHSIFNWTYNWLILFLSIATWKNIANQQWIYQWKLNIEQR